VLLLLIAGASSNVSAGLSFANSARLAPAPRLPADTYVQLRSNHQRMTHAKAIHPSPSPAVLFANDNDAAVSRISSKTKPKRLLNIRVRSDIFLDCAADSLHFVPLCFSPPERGGCSLAPNLVNDGAIMSSF